MKIYIDSGNYFSNFFKITLDLPAIAAAPDPTRCQIFCAPPSLPTPPQSKPFGGNFPQNYEVRGGGGKKKLLINRDFSQRLGEGAEPPRSEGTRRSAGCGSRNLPELALDSVRAGFIKKRELVFYLSVILPMKEEESVLFCLLTRASACY